MSYCGHWLREQNSNLRLQVMSLTRVHLLYPAFYQYTDIFDHATYFLKLIFQFSISFTAIAKHWCPRQDSDLYVFRPILLGNACLPFPPQGLLMSIISTNHVQAYNLRLIYQCIPVPLLRNQKSTHAKTHHPCRSPHNPTSLTSSKSID